METNNFQPQSIESDSMLEVECQVRFPAKTIQDFGPGSVGRIIMTLDSDGTVVRATAPLYDAGYQ